MIHVLVFYQSLGSLWTHSRDVNLYIFFRYNSRAIREVGSLSLADGLVEIEPTTLKFEVSSHFTVRIPLVRKLCSTWKGNTSHPILNEVKGMVENIAERLTGAFTWDNDNPEFRNNKYCIVLIHKVCNVLPMKPLQ